MAKTEKIKKRVVEDGEAELAIITEEETIGNVHTETVINCLTQEKQLIFISKVDHDKETRERKIAEITDFNLTTMKTLVFLYNALIAQGAIAHNDAPDDIRALIDRYQLFVNETPNANG